MIAHFSWPTTWHDAKTFRNDSLSKLCLLSSTSTKLFKTLLEKNFKDLARSVGLLAENSDAKKFWSLIIKRERYKRWASITYISVSSSKLTWQWNIPIFSRKYIFTGSIFHCYTSLPFHVYMYTLYIYCILFISIHNITHTSQLK